jgi:methyl-accepting chemotaxis protein
MKLGQKIVVAPSVVIGFLLLFGAIALTGMIGQGRALEEIYLGRFAAYRGSAELAMELADSHMQAYRLITWMNGANEAKVKQMTATLSAKLAAAETTLSAQIESQGSDEQARAALTQISPQVVKYRKNVLQAIDIAGADAAMGTSALQVADEEYQSMHQALQAAIASQLQRAQSGYDLAAVAAQRAIAIEFVVLLLAVATSLMVSLGLTRSILRPIHSATRVSRAIAEGDLTVSTQVSGNDEVAELAQSLEAMRRNLSGIMGTLRSSADRVTAHGAGLSDSAGAVASASAAQTDEAQSVAASVEEIAVTIAAMADSAESARQVSQRSGEAAREGRKVIGDTLDEIKQIAATVEGAASTIRKLGDEFGQISGIVAVIKEIADQTNLLALNAAIEAARAGDQGRGFAVVADEVRKLAERTSQSTSQIAVTIDTVQHRASAAVEQMGHAVQVAVAGVELAGRADASNSRVTEGTEELASTVESIGAALKEQSSAVNDIAARVENIVRMSERNSNAARQSATSARELNGLAQTVRDEISRFRT